ncbi:MAG TPA: hypothetical protein VFQ91_21560 [Bryobacteraceae bacterium]|nr:hypothetical protein [Bryobacteraceae bacterium]
MSAAAPVIQTALLYKGGPMLLDLYLAATEYHITVTGPRMLFERLQLATTLSAFDGYTAPRLHAFADALEGTIHCGLVGIVAAEIAVDTMRAGGVLTISAGPPNMYQSLLVLRTRTGETFRNLFLRIFQPAVAPAFVGLQAVPAEAHLEHTHSGTPGGHHGHS